VNSAQFGAPRLETDPEIQICRRRSFLSSIPVYRAPYRAETVARDDPRGRSSARAAVVSLRLCQNRRERTGVTQKSRQDHDRHCPGQRCLPVRLSAAGIEGGPLFRRINKAGTVAAHGLLADPSPISCGTRRVRRPHVFRSLAAIRLSHVCNQRRIDFQDDGREPAQVGGDFAWLCARRRIVQGSRWKRATLVWCVWPLMTAFNRNMLSIRQETNAAQVLAFRCPIDLDMHQIVLLTGYRFSVASVLASVAAPTPRGHNLVAA
jgi:hypothetical protein